MVIQRLGSSTINMRIVERDLDMINCYSLLQNTFNRYIHCVIGLLSRYPAKLNVTWNAILRHESTNYAGTWRQIPGHDILPLFSKNYTIKVWETLKASLKRRGMSKRMTLTLKMDLFDEYSYPIPLPNNIFLRLPKESPFPDLEYVILGQKGTGRTIR